MHLEPEHRPNRERVVDHAEPDRQPHRGVLRAAGETAGRRLDLFDIDHLVVTHVHGDHMNGVEGVAFFKRFAQERRLELVASPEVRAVIWEQRLRAPTAPALRCWKSTVPTAI